ncbi:MAG: 50S ribosomal protein L29 [Chlamydiae bacterium]|nr:50S ribosomal protein L29 [Chlamydiota bacterium]
MLKAKELRDQSSEELELMYHDSMHKLYELKNQARMEKPEHPHEISQLRRHIARLLTIIKEKQRVKSLTD